MDTLKLKSTKIMSLVTAKIRQNVILVYLIWFLYWELHQIVRTMKLMILPQI